MCGHVLLLFLAVLAPLAAAYSWQHCGGTGNYTANSTYKANLNTLAAGHPKNASSPTLFASGTTGAFPDQVYALVLCRGDTTDPSDCRTCATQAFQDVQQLCPYDRDATIYNNHCLLRFSNQNFLASPANSYEEGHCNTHNITSDSDRFQRLVYKVLNATADYAAANSTQRFATGEVDFNASYPKIYALMQCTPDLTPTQCRSCLAGEIVLERQLFPWNPLGARVFGERCNLRFELYSFYIGGSMLQLPAEAATPAAIEGRKRKLWIIGVVVPLLAIFAFFIFCSQWIHRRRIGKINLQKQSMVNFRTEEAVKFCRIEENNSEFTLFDFSQIVDATNNFSQENKLGKGGFGPVYKGQLLDGLEIAVKRLASHSGQGLVEFKNEIQLIAKLQHTNLVRLLGCCIQEEEKILIYEYMPNKSLDFFIFDATRGALMNWNKRLKIIEGIAQGLLYLHKHSRLRVIHRDLKASNILLDYDMNPKISDFGLAKIFGSNDIEGNTNRVVGTYGYMAPEYASEGLFSVKSDVFSFGVLLLEIVSGKRNAGFHQYEDFLNLIGYAWQLWKEGRWLELVDASLVNECRMIEIVRYTHIALLCVQENATDRPTMSDVVVMLNSESLSLPEPKQPAYFNVVAPNGEISTIVESCSINNVTITAEDGR